MEWIAFAVAVAALFGARHAANRARDLEAALSDLRDDVVRDRVRLLALESEAAATPPVRAVAADPVASAPAAAVAPAEPAVVEPVAPAPAAPLQSPWAAPEREGPAEVAAGERGFDAAPLRLSAPSDDVAPERGWNFEELFGRRLPVWGGGIALALAGFFLVKYSIEVGLVTPAVRTLLGLLFGIGLIGAAEAAHRLPKFAFDPRTAQALSGAGVATVYGVAYMATNLYGLISAGAGFAAMAVVTAAALALSLRHGAPTAVLGLIGGFATPALVNTGEGSVPALLGYLLLTVGGLLGVARTQGWRWLGLLALGGGFGWSGLLLVTGLAGIELTATGLFIVLLAAGATIALGVDREDDDPMTAALLPFAAAAIAFVQLAVLIGKGGFGWSEWGLYALLAAGVTVLAIRDAAFRLLPAAALVIALVTFAAWHAAAVGDAVLVAGGLLLLFALPGYLLSQRAGGLLWAGQAVAATLLTLALFDLKFGDALAESTWALLCVALGLPALVMTLVSHRRRIGDDPRRALFASTAALLAGAAAAYVVPPLYLPALFLALAAATASIARRWDDPWLPLSAAAGAAAAAASLAFFVPDVADGPARFAGLVRETDGRLGLWGFAAPAVLLALLAWADPSALRRQVYAAAIAGLVAIGATQFVGTDLRPVAIAIVAAGLVEAARRQDRLPLVRPAAAIAAAALLWAAMPLARIAGGSLAALAGDPLLATELPDVRTAMLYLLLPAAVLLVGLWRSERLSLALAAGPAVLALAAGLVLYKQLFGIDSAGAFVALGFAERMLLTQLLFAAGAAAYTVAGRHAPLLAAGRVLTALAVLRFVWFDLLVFNPLVEPQSVGGWPVANLLVPAYGLPLLWLARWRATEPALTSGASRAVHLASIASLVLLAGLLVRQLFHGAILVGGEIGDAENYAYSLTGLLVAVGLLLWGTARADQTTRLASLALMLATVAKVFLADAAALEGLWRIASFLGLGLSLIGVSWFYTRHVFARRAVAAA